jgi:alanine racemase
VAEDRPHIIGGGPDFHLAGGVLTVDLSALIENYRELARLSAPATTAAVVKADAYGAFRSRLYPFFRRAAA